MANFSSGLHYSAHKMKRDSKAFHLMGNPSYGTVAIKTKFLFLQWPTLNRDGDIWIDMSIGRSDSKKSAWNSWRARFDFQHGGIKANFLLSVASPNFASNIFVFISILQMKIQVKWRKASDYRTCNDEFLRIG